MIDLLMRKVTLGLLMLVTICGSLQAQNVAEVRKLLKNDSYLQALSMANQMIASDGKGGNGYFYKGYSLFKLSLEEGLPDATRQKYLADAKATFELATSKAKREGHGYAGLGIIAAANNNMAEMKEQFKKAQEMTGNDVPMLISMAEACMDLYNAEALKPGKGNREIRNEVINEATKLITRAETIDKNDAAIYITLGDLYTLQRISELPASNYKKAIIVDPNSAAAHYALSQYLFKEGQYNEAKDELLKTKDIDPKFALAYRDLSEIYFLANEFDYAKKFAREYRDLLGNDKRANARYGTFLYLAKSYPDAAEALGTVLKDTSSYILQRLYAYSLTEVEKYPEARVAIDKYFAMVQPDQIIYKDHYYNARIQLNEGKVDEAIQNMEKAIAKDSSLTKSYKDIYELYKEKEDYPKAVMFFEKYLKHNPNLTDQFMLGWLNYAKLQDYNKAETVLGDMVKQRPDVIDAVVYLARSSAKIDSNSSEGRAKPHYELLVQQITKQSLQEKYKNELAEAYFYLGYYYYQQEEFPMAYAYCNLSLEVKPGNKNAQQIIDYLKGQNVKPAELNPDGTPKG